MIFQFELMLLFCEGEPLRRVVVYFKLYLAKNVFIILIVFLIDFFSFRISLYFFYNRSS